MKIEEDIKKLHQIAELKPHLQEQLAKIMDVGLAYFPTTVSIGPHFKLSHARTTTKLGMIAKELITKHLEIIDLTLNEAASGKSNITELLDNYDRMLNEVM
ncbi:hypothetical protein D3C71_234630 [compost metagenome]